MRKTALIVAAWTAFLLVGCDDVASIPPDPYLPLRQAAVKPPTAPTKVINRASLEETFRYAAHIHDTMRQYRDVLLATPKDTNLFAGRRSALLSDDAQWRHLLYIRQEWMSQGDFTNEHPARKIRTAIYYLIEESKHLDNVFLHNDPLDPKFAAATDKAFEEAITALKNYQDPPAQR